MKPLATLSLLSALACATLPGCIILIGSSITTESAKPPMHPQGGADHCEKGGKGGDCCDGDDDDDGEDDQDDMGDGDDQEEMDDEGPDAAQAEPAAQLKLSLVSVDSEETTKDDNQGANALDGNADTFWHTPWGDDSPAGPHEIVIGLDRACKIDRFTYLPRQDGNENGNIKDYELYVSQDGKDFGKAVSQGTFENGPEQKVVKFGAVSCRFVKLKALSEVNGEAWASAAELGVVPEGEDVPEAPKATEQPEDGDGPETPQDPPAQAAP